VVLVRVLNLACPPGQDRAVVVLEEVEQRFRFAFATDPHEARRLARAMGLARCSCNPVYDFVHALLEAFDARIERVVLDDAGAGEGVTATVHLRHAGGELSLPCYPPDALALALRTRAPIYATEQVLVHARPRGAPRPAGPPPGPGEVSRWVERVRPEDF
jgi:bifunctional DNase/RNase